MALSRNVSAYCSRERPSSHAAISMTSPASCQLGDEFRGVFQVGGVEALGEPAVDGREQLARLAPPALFSPQPRQARRRAQLPRLRLLRSSDLERAAEARFRPVLVSEIEAQPQF